MIDPKQLTEMTAADKKSVDAAEKFIDAQINEAIKNSDDPSKLEVSIPTSELSKALGGLTAKVREAVTERYEKGGWKATFIAETGTILIRVKRKGGRRKGQTKAALAAV